MEVWCVTVAVFLLLVDLMHRRQRWAARYLPGPLPLPGLGNLLQIDFQNMPYPRYKFAASLEARVLVNGLVAIYEVLKCSKYTVDHPPMPTYQHLGLRPQSKVVLATYGPAWREQQHFSMSTMHNFDLGKKSLEQWVIKEPRTLLNRAVCNVISSLIYAHHFENHDQRLAKILGLLEDTLKEESGFMPEVLGSGESVQGLPGRVFPAQKAFMALVDELLEEHRMTWDPAQPPRDLTDAFLVEVEKAKGNPGHLLQGMMLITNLSSVLKDETVWEKPLRFHPGHFLDAQGHFVKQEAFMPFSAGHCVCLGEPLARMELSLFFTCLLQRFSFSVPPGQAWPSDRGVFAFIVAPSPYQLCAVLY
ncbi:cytochrome P450 2D17-like [Callospermophilus lateralis]